LKEGTIVYTSTDKASRVVLKHLDPLTHDPLVVLVNQGTASAVRFSLGRCKITVVPLVGETTFGKGFNPYLTYRMVLDWLLLAACMKHPTTDIS